MLSSGIYLHSPTHMVTYSFSSNLTQTLVHVIMLLHWCISDDSLSEYETTQKMHRLSVLGITMQGTNAFDATLQVLMVVIAAINIT